MLGVIVTCKACDRRAVIIRSDTLQVPNNQLYCSLTLYKKQRTSLKTCVFLTWLSLPSNIYSLVASRSDVQPITVRSQPFKKATYLDMRFIPAHGSITTWVLTHFFHWLHDSQYYPLYYLLPISSMITHRVPLDDLPKLYQAFDKCAGGVKKVFVETIQCAAVGGMS